MKLHNRLAGLLGHVFLIGPHEALRILQQHDTDKIRYAWLAYTRYKGRVWNWPEVSKVTRDSACIKAKMLKGGGKRWRDDGDLGQAAMPLLCMREWPGW